MRYMVTGALYLTLRSLVLIQPQHLGSFRSRYAGVSFRPSIHVWSQQQHEFTYCPNAFHLSIMFAAILGRVLFLATENFL